jgi:hypothetical protein
MPRYLFLCALLFVGACGDDATGPGGGEPPEWVELTLPAELEGGMVVALASGRQRVVALVRASNGDWVIEERAGSWVPVLDGPLPVPRTILLAERSVPFPAAARDVVVDARQRVYVVGSAVSSDGPLAFPTPTIWAEADTGWVLVQELETEGSLDRAVAVGASGFTAVGVLQGQRLLRFEGTPGRAGSWTSFEMPDPDPLAGLTAMAQVEGHWLLGGYTIGVVAPPGPLRASFLDLDGERLTALHPPCGPCADLRIEAIQPIPAGILWAGTAEGVRTAEDPTGISGRQGWLWLHRPDRGQWIELDLPDEITSVHDVLRTALGSVLIAAEGPSPGLYRWTGSSLVAEPAPRDALVYCLEELGIDRVFGGGQGFGSRGVPVLVERQQ